MNITTSLFDAALKCSTKCFLRSRGETGKGNVYADWVRAQTESYRGMGIKGLMTGAEHDELIIRAPGSENLNTAEWRLAVDVMAHAQNLESSLHAVERVPANERGQPTQIIPIRFIFTNKLTRDDKLLLAFDGLVLSEMLGREIKFGRIIHGDNYATLKVRTSFLTSEVRKLTSKIAMLLSNNLPPDLVLNRHWRSASSKLSVGRKRLKKTNSACCPG